MLLVVVGGITPDDLKAKVAAIEGYPSIKVKQLAEMRKWPALQVDVYEFKLWQLRRKKAGSED